MGTIRMPGRLFFVVASGMVIALAPVGAVLVAPSIDPARAVAQGCSDSETEDSYSLQCVPSRCPTSAISSPKPRWRSPASTAIPVVARWRWRRPPLIVLG